MNRTDTCPDCGAAFAPAPAGRNGFDCDCPCFAADLHGGHGDGDRWWMPRRKLSRALVIWKGDTGQFYWLDRASLLDGEVTCHYVWVSRMAPQKREAAEEGSRA